MSWSLEGEYMENCSCEVLCPCITSSMAGPADYERCQVPLAMHIEKGEKDGLSLDGLNAVIPSGTYCATSSITVSGKYNTCNCTFIASTVSLNGNNLTMTPYYQDLIIDAYSSGSDFNIAASGDNLTGTIFAPYRRLSLSGSAGSTYNLFLEGNTISISGRGWSMSGYGPPTGYGGTQLVQ